MSLGRRIWHRLFHGEVVNVCGWDMYYEDWECPRCERKGWL